MAKPTLKGLQETIDKRDVEIEELNNIIKQDASALKRLKELVPNLEAKIVLGGIEAATFHSMHVELNEVLDDHVLNTGLQKTAIKDLQEEVIKLQKELKTFKESDNRWHKIWGERGTEIEQMHCAMDAINGVAKRKAKTGGIDYSGNKETVELGLHARFSSCVQALLLQGQSKK